MPPGAPSGYDASDHMVEKHQYDEMELLKKVPLMTRPDRRNRRRVSF